MRQRVTSQRHVKDLDTSMLRHRIKSLQETCCSVIRCGCATQPGKATLTVLHASKYIQQCGLIAWNDFSKRSDRRLAPKTLKN